MPCRRLGNSQGSGVAGEYYKTGIDAFWKIPFKDDYIYIRPEYCLWQKRGWKIHDSYI